MPDMNIPQTDPAPGDPGRPGEPGRPGNPRLPAGRPVVGHRRFGAGTRWLAGLAVAVVLAGGTVLGVSLGGAASPQAARALLTGSASGDSGGGSAGGGGGTAEGGDRTASGGGGQHHATASTGSGRDATRAPAGLGARPGVAAHRFTARLRAYARLWLLARRALHGQITIATRTGPRTIAFERGTIRSISGSSVVVKAADGTAWTWQVSRATLIVKAGRRVGPTALAAGQQVFVIGQVAGRSDDARRVVIRG